MDTRLGKREGDSIVYPQQTISGAVLPLRPFDTVIIGAEGHFAVLDIQLFSERRNELILELERIVTYAAPKKSSKEVEG
jgi:hypothetical protein